ncbi:hypothetical protein ACFO4N_14575 [Camelliibacillus cellulosilyticus]|uniref:ABC transporter permease n=1 Tax=Camelliibacillus cellulosilyticus TaxID=2174486 RepID=A0ABV9GRQ5_9BACL
MNPIANVLKIYMKDKMVWLFIPWIVVLSSFLVNYIIGIVSSTTDGDPIYTGGVGSIYAYILVAGMMTLTHTFPFALGMSVRRIDYFLGTGTLFVLISALFAVILYLFGLIEQWTEGWGVMLHFFHLPYLNDGSAIQQLLLNFILMMNMCFLGFVITSIFRRFGRFGLLVTAVIALIVISILSYLCTYYGWWMPIFQWFGQRTALETALWTVPLVIIYCLCSYAMLRKATIS